MITASWSPPLPDRSVQPLAARIDHFRGRLEEVAADDPFTARELAEELDRLSQLSNRTAAGNIEAGLGAADEHDFDRAQEELRELRRQLAVLALQTGERFFAELPADMRRRLSQLALIELAAPMTDRAGLERIRRNLQWVRERRGADHP